MDATNLLGGFRVVPIVVIDDAALALPLAETLVNAGIGVIEITLRTADAIKAIEKVASAVPQMVVGAGSVRSAQQFADVASAGAKFVVSPGATMALSKAAAEHGLPYVPGAATPSEMISLLEQGYKLQKFFPAEAAGGVEFLKSVASPLPEARFVPTGGISAARALEYLELPNVSGVGGSWISPPALIAAKNFSEIAKLAADAARLGM